MATVPFIAYPFARNRYWTPVPISMARRGMPYFCVGCKNPMITKMGDVNAHHFAHKTNASCNPDNALHETAKISIIEKFKEYSKAKKDWIIDVPCFVCGEATKYNLTDGSAEIKQELTVIEHTRSDIAVLKSDMSVHTILEVAVTHDLEDITRRLYVESKIPVIVIAPSWSNFLRVKYALNIKCHTSIRRRDCLEHFMSYMPARPKPKEITHDRYNNELYYNTRRKVNRYAQLLADAGFVQKYRQTVFVHESEYWKAYVDLDSTDETPIWQVDGVPMLYAAPKSESRDCCPDCKECVLEKAEDVLLRWESFFLQLVYGAYKIH